MNKLFKNNILDVSIKVRGETNNYEVKISFGGFLDILHEQLERNNNKLELRSITRALISSFNSDNVYIHCSCPDWCLEGNTKIKLLNNEVISISELLSRYEHGEELWVYSTNEQGDFKPGKITDVWISGYTTEMVKVTLDNGKEIITTPEHRYMLRTGDYEQAKNLVPGQSLMPLYFKINPKGYEDVKINSQPYPTKYESVYKTVAGECLQEQIESVQEDIVNIHHKDFNKLNNYPSNLQPMGKNEHWKYHYEHLIDSGNLEKFLEGGKKYWQTPEARIKQADVMRRVMSEYYANIDEDTLNTIKNKRVLGIKKAIEQGCLNTDKFIQASKQRGKDMHTPEREALIKIGIKKYWDNLTPEEKDKRDAITLKNREKAIQKIKGQPFTQEHKEHIRQARLSESAEKLQQHTRKINESKILKVLQKMISNNMPLTQENYDLLRGRGCPRVQKLFENIDQAVSYFGLNHKVKSVEFITYDEPIPVYDLTVDKYNNFYVDAGVILHNCYRFSFWARVNNISSAIDQEQTDNGKEIQNPHDTKGPGCKHTLLVLSNTSWIIKVASVINNYVKYMEQHQPRLYADIIYPAIYQQEYQEPVQLDMTDIDNNELTTDNDILDTANKWNKARTQFQKGNTQGIRFAPEEKKQVNFDNLLDSNKEFS